MAINRQQLKLYDDDGGNAVSPQLDGVTDPSTILSNCFGFYSSNDYPGILNNKSFPVDSNGYGFRLSFGGAKDVTGYKYLTFKLQNKEIDTFRNLLDDTEGQFILLYDSSNNWKKYKVMDKYSYHDNERTQGYFYYYGSVNGGIFYIDFSKEIESSGTLDMTDLQGIEWHIVATNYTDSKDMSMHIDIIYAQNETMATGTIDFDDFVSEFMINPKQAISWLKPTAPFIGAASVAYTPPIEFSLGDGSTTTTLDESNVALAFMDTWDLHKIDGDYSRYPMIQVDRDNRIATINQSATDSIKLTDSVLSGIQSSNNVNEWGLEVKGSSSGTCEFLRTSFIKGTKSILAHSKVTDSIFDNMQVVEINTDTQITGSILRNIVGTSKGLYIQTAPADYSGIDLKIANNNRDITINPTSAGTYDLSGLTYDTGYNIKIHNESVTHNITIKLPAGAVTTVTTAGGTVTIDSPTVNTGLSFTGLTAGSQVMIFETGTQTVIDSVESSGTTFDWNPVYSSDQTVDYTIYKEDKAYIRRTGILCSDSVQTISISQATDRPYEPSSGLTYGTDYSYNRSTDKLTITKNTAVQNYYSALKESFRNETSLRNTEFSIFPNGGGSFSFERGISFANSSDINNLHSDGFRMVNVSGTVTSIYCAITSQGNLSGLQAEYLQSDSGTPVDTLNMGPIQQCVHIYENGSFDYRNFLVFKCQANGYRQAECNVVDTYGTLADEHYIIPLNAVAIPDLTLGDPGITGVTLTDHGNSPVTWDAGNGDKDYSITITDTNNNSGEDILRWLNYFLSLDATFQGKNPFNWSELVLDNGSSYESLRGVIYGDVGANLKGVRVVNGSNQPHSDFSRFQADDGSYGVPPVVANVSITAIEDGSRLRIYNVTKSTEVYNDVPGTSYSDSYTDGTTYSAGDTISIRLTCVDGTTAKDEYSASVIASSSGWSLSADQKDNLAYNAIGVDGSSVTGFSADYIQDDVDVTIAADFNMSSWYAWWCYNNTTEQGIREFFGGVEAKDQANFEIKNDIVSIYFDNTTSTNLKQLDNRRIFRTDGAYPVKNPGTGTGGIDVVWRNTILLAETGVSGLTTAESTQLFGTALETSVQKNNKKIGGLY